jgi:hypothetical protein
LEPCSKKVVTPDDFPFINLFLHGLFGEEQLPFIMAWVQRSYRSLHEFEAVFSQSAFVCGPRNNGKTLFSVRILAELFGGKIVNPYDYLTGQTTFNNELYESFLWAVNDEEAPANETARQKYFARLKSFSVNPIHTYHPKFCDRLVIPFACCRIFTLNDDPNSVGVLPEVNLNTADKLSFYASNPFKGLWPKRKELETAIAKELPFLARWLLDIYEPPKHVLDPDRMGVKSYFNPRIMELSKQQDYSYNLLELLTLWCEQGAVWNDEKLQKWVGTPTDLMAQLSSLDHLQNNLKEWSVPKLAKSLAALARVERAGVKFLEDTGERSFEFDREKLTRCRRTVGEGEQL